MSKLSVWWSSLRVDPDKALSSNKRLERKTRLNPVNRDRKKRRQEAGEVYGPYHRHVSSLPCLVANDKCWGEVVGHHLISVGAGGKDRANEVPLCTFHHRAIHTLGQSRFERKHLRDLDLDACRIWQEHVG